jgi:hypothetical protein
MASEVDICNLALSHLGDDATVAALDPPEGSVQADHCARFYPMARDALLEMHEWNFATKRVALADLGSDWDQWGYAYAKPNNMLKALAVLPAGAGADTETQPYAIEVNADDADVIYTNQEGAVLRFISRVTDPTKFSPLFVEALTWLLASKLAGPVLKGETGAAAAKAAFQMFGTQFRLAITSDANQQRKQPEAQAAWIAGR